NAAPPPFLPVKYQNAQLPGQAVNFTQQNVNQYVLQGSVNSSQLNALIAMSGWNQFGLISFINNPPPSLPPPNVGVFALRARLGFFGHNAPAYSALLNPKGDSLYPHNWDSGWDIWTDSMTAQPYSGTDAFLERSLTGVISDSWAVFERPTDQYSVYRIRSATEESLAGFGLGGKLTGLALANPDGSDLTNKPSTFQVRKTTAHVQSEQMILAELPIEDYIPAGTSEMMLDGMVTQGLKAGQPVALTGTSHDPSGVGV